MFKTIIIILSLVTILPISFVAEATTSSPATDNAITQEPELVVAQMFRRRQQCRIVRRRSCTFNRYNRRTCRLVTRRVCNYNNRR